MEKNYKISIKKRLIIALCIMVMIVLFVPRVYALKDGGSKEFTALTYRITKVHSMYPVESEEEFTTGTIIEIFRQRSLQQRRLVTLYTAV